MSDAQKENEPTMEEILASIRKIISEDEPDEAAESAEAAPDDDAGAAGDEPMELTQMVSDDGSVVDLRADDEPEEDRAPAEPEEPPEFEAEAEDEPFEEEEEDEDELAVGLDDGDIELEVDEEEDEPLPELAARPVEVDPSFEGLVAPVTAAAATATMARLSDSLDAEHAGMGMGAGDKTLTVLVQETLAPHLKAWLDAHLPGLVERIVREEIKKMVKRAEYR